MQSFAESRSLISKIQAKYKKSSKIIYILQAYQVCNYNNYFSNVESKFNQKVEFRIRKIAIERLSQKLDFKNTAFTISLKKLKK